MSTKVPGEGEVEDTERRGQPWGVGGRMLRRAPFGSAADEQGECPGATGHFLENWNDYLVGPLQLHRSLLLQEGCPHGHREWNFNTEFYFFIDTRGK